MFENGRQRVGEPNRQTVLQRGANQVFRTETRPGVHEKNVVGQVSQAQTEEESVHQGQHRVLNEYDSCPCTINYKI